MREKKYYVALDDFERRVIMNCLNEMHSGSGEVNAWITGADEGDVGAVYSDGRTVMWDLDGKVINSK